MILGFRGTDLQQGTIALIEEIQPGALIAFRHNVGTLEQVAQKNYALQMLSLKHTGLPLLLMVDQEGGPVVRIRTHPPPLSAAAIGQTGDLGVARGAGRHTGRLLRGLGYNMNLAPVLDLSSPNQRSFIGQRSFGEHPALVARMGLAYAQGLWAESVLPTAKHFPGHGGIQQDSHYTLPIKTLDRAELLRTDALPFSLFSAEQRTSAIMMAHVAYPKLDPSGAPASFSQPIIEGILRQELKYQGLVITDDLEMHGAEFYTDVGERAIRAIEAGNDLIMVAWTPRHQKRAYQALVQAVQTGRLSQERLRRSLYRILSVKLQLPQPELMPPPSEINFDEWIAQMNQAGARMSEAVSRWHFYASLKRSPQLVRGMGQGKNLFIFTPDSQFFTHFQTTGRKAVNLIPISPRRPASAHPQMTQNLENNLFLFFASGTGSLRQAQNLPAKIKRRTILINTTYPGAVSQRTDFFAIIDSYSQDPQVARWLADHLFSE